jgi:hypothetical protein
MQDARLSLSVSEVRNTRLAIEREVGQLQLLKQSEQFGEGNRDTRARENRRKARRKKIRVLLANLGAWAAFMQPVGAAATINEKELFEGKFPWDVHQQAQQVSREVMELQLYKLQQELARSREEIAYLKGDAGCALAYLQQVEANILQRLQQLSSTHAEGLGFVLCTKLAQISQLIVDAKRAFLANKLL